MNSLIVKGIKQIENMRFHEIEGGFGESKKAMLVKDIATIHSRDLKDINRNINNNIKRFKKGIDIIDLKVGEYKSLSLELGYSNQSYANANNIYLLSERGYAKLLKILEDDVAWEQYEKLVDGYFNMRKEIKEKVQALNTSELSPELQMFNQMFKAIANNELEQKKIKAEIKETKEEIKGIREVVNLTPNAWRKDTSEIINKIARKLGGYEHIRVIREESYKALNENLGVSLAQRLLNKKKKMALEGLTKSKIDKVNQLDVIAEDKKLINGYISIIGKMAIKYGVA